MVGLHLTPRREHRALLNELDKIWKHCLRNNVGDRLAGTIAVGDLNVQYIRSFGKSRLEDKRSLRSLEDRRTSVDNPMKRHINQKRQTQCRTNVKGRTVLENRTKRFCKARLGDRRYIRSLKNRCTELKCHTKVNDVRTHFAFVASSDGTAQSDSDMVQQIYQATKAISRTHAEHQSSSSAACICYTEIAKLAQHPCAVF
ncbi:Hypothetical protein, putative [Bodo saltans]|uniref:Uncharacterized protein n=1 Tax=Bodo saltans TaxID=75058 RepID=A0A0S4J3Z3_BODSA|nr:Hypothetical protein, putative [Bodo saltans]|eukprot:CUG78139.1 Hypothetical protein, putative [Bodo saltans]